jgi:hypothetical protein
MSLDWQSPVCCAEKINVHGEKKAVSLVPAVPEPLRVEDRNNGAKEGKKNNLYIRGHEWNGYVRTEARNVFFVHLYA